MQRVETRKRNFYAKLEADRYYHVYNRTNNRELLFRTDEDRRFFLKRYRQYLTPFVDTFSYCLLPNHFHFSVRIKPVDVILEHLKSLEAKDLTIPHRNFLATHPDYRSTHPVIENQFLRLFTSYATVFNKRHQRKGNLFHRPFKRLEVENEVHFTYLIFYIHANPRIHKLRRDFTKYFWSSYQAFLSDKPTQIARKEVLDWFGGKKAFIDFHRQQLIALDRIQSLIIEE